MKATFKNFSVSANYTGSKPAGFNSNNWNHHNITVTNTENGLRTRFDFWASIINPELETEYDVLNAFYCFVSDAISGNKSFWDFCSDFGYDADSMTAWKIWNSCKRSTKKLTRIFPGDIYDLANELVENYG